LTSIPLEETILCKSCLGKAFNGFIVVTDNSNNEIKIFFFADFLNKRKFNNEIFIFSLLR